MHDIHMGKVSRSEFEYVGYIRINMYILHCKCLTMLLNSFPYTFYITIKTNTTKGTELNSNVEISLTDLLQETSKEIK